jgi:hypothetical protein
LRVARPLVFLPLAVAGPAIAFLALLVVTGLAAAFFTGVAGAEACTSVTAPNTPNKQRHFIPVDTTLSLSPVALSAGVDVSYTM